LRLGFSRRPARPTRPPRDEGKRGYVFARPSEMVKSLSAAAAESMLDEDDADVCEFLLAIYGACTG
jgi:hypothetical protein